MTSWRWRAGIALMTVSLAPCVIAPACAFGDRTQESVFQDDDHLIYNSTATVSRTVAVLRSLGVQRLRITIKWSAIAPAPTSSAEPRNFDASNPADYPSAAWAPYDRVLELAVKQGIGVEFNVTAPGPLWAMAAHPARARDADHWWPSATDFKRFMVALGRRYSGRYTTRSGKIPRVRVWSIWNEPNQPGWLAPQWRRGIARGRHVLTSPWLYRRYVAAAAAALERTGHGSRRDTILIGDLAPEGSGRPGPDTAMAPMRFLRALYCVDNHYRRLRGGPAAALGCPAGASRKAFVRANPLLFAASGFAHHPYYFLLPPSAGSPDPNFVPIADLHRLEHGLDRVFAAYRVSRQLPLYLTEYGYQTDPPDPYQRVTPAQQAAYLNEADFIAWRDPRVRSVAQFLLYDSLPDHSYPSFDPRYWDTFQTGLLFADGRRKPAFASYRLPIWLPSRSFHRGARLMIWGQLRPAWSAALARAALQWRPRRGRRRYNTIATLISHGERGYATVRTTLPGSGMLRIAWRSPSGAVLMSRSIGVRMR